MILKLLMEKIMTKRENNKNDFIKVLKSTIREICSDYDQENFANKIENYVSGNCKKLIINPNDVNFDNFDGDKIRNGYAFFKMKNASFDDVCNEISKLDFTNSYYIIITVDDMKVKKEIESQIKNLYKYVKTQTTKKSERGKINASQIYVNFLNENANKKYYIRITKRVDSIFNEETEFAEGYVFTAKLFDIVELYNSIGDSLFDYNVRYKIKNELNVDGEIRKTLSENPEMFWFYNNGITIIINDKNFSVNNPRKVSLNKTDKNIISVINGAQTISAASDYFSNASNSRDAAEKAHVILRIININSSIDGNSGESSIINQISIALNRQKSISEEDISFTFDFVDDLNKISWEIDNDNRTFELAKRGAFLFEYKNYSLKTFAKIVKCYLGQKPGTARNQSNKLIKSKYDDKNQTYTFADEEIYKKIETADDFFKYYSPVNFADSLFGLFSSASKQYKKEKNDDNLMSDLYNYASHYFVAKTIYTLNNYNNADFSNFNYSLENISKENQNEIVNKFITEFAFKINDTHVDSNEFKKDILYNEKIKKKSEMPEFESFLEKIFIS